MSAFRVSFPIRRSLLRPVLFSALAVVTFVATCAPATKVRGVEFEPISIATQNTVVAGENVYCAVQLTGGPAVIHITSDPPGAVSFDGMVGGASAVVPAVSDPATPAGPVTVYLATDGDSVAAHSAQVLEAAAPVEAGNGPR